MSTERETTRIVRSWLEEGVTVLPDRVLDTVLDQVPATPQRRPWWPARRYAFMNSYAKLAAAAAALVVVAVVGLNLLGDGGSSGASPARQSPTVPPPSAAPTAEPTAGVLPEGALEPGEYFLTSIAPLRITFRVSERGWVKNPIPNVIWSSSSAVRLGFSAMSNVLADPCVAGIERDPPVGPSVDDLATALATLPGVEPVAPTAVELDGYSGKLVDLVIPDSTEPCEGMWITDDEGGRIRYWILDVAGTRLVITAVERPGSPTLGERLQRIIDSIQIQPG